MLKRLTKLKFVDKFFKTNITKLNKFSNNSTLKTHSKSYINNKILTNSNLCSYFSTEINNIDQNKQLTEDEIIKEICGADEELKKRLRVLMLEIDVIRQTNYRVPDHIKLSQWQELLELKSRSARSKYLSFLFSVEKKNLHQLEKKLKKKEEYEQMLKEKSDIDVTSDGERISYGLQGSNIFLRIYDTTIDQLSNSRLIQAMKFGEKLVVDCGYENNMTKFEKRNTAKQITLLFADNRQNMEPFDLHFCNMDRNGEVFNSLEKNIPTIKEPWFPFNIHTNSYLDLFPKEKLVYLTPHCQTNMDKFDHDAIYIIGAIVDKTCRDPLSLAKAKKENIKMLRLPLDKYLDWGSGSGKSLTINQMLSILLDLKKTQDWNYSLRHVPKRKLAQEIEVDDKDKKIQDYYLQYRKEKMIKNFKKNFTFDHDLILQSQMKSIKKRKEKNQFEENKKQFLVKEK